MDDEMPLKREDLRKRAEEKAAKLAAEGMELRPVTVSGRTLAKRFWGKEWMKSLSACEVYGMRLAPGRTYLRYGCVLDLKTVPGRIDALVMGEHLYEVCIQASPPDEEVLARLRARCAGQIGSWIDLLKGNFYKVVFPNQPQVHLLHREHRQFQLSFFNLKFYYNTNPIENEEL